MLFPLRKVCQVEGRLASVENQLLHAQWFFGLDLKGKVHISPL